MAVIVIVAMVVVAVVVMPLIAVVMGMVVIVAVAVTTGATLGIRVPIGMTMRGSTLIPMGMSVPRVIAVFGMVARRYADVRTSHYAAAWQQSSV